ncbi:PQQ-binding-like beta-propeller repeat protein [Salinisphaera hydrothermalis]|uniref:PQQ-binding-like beta-propeller repeat protein n=1 Tax=Salinisphaera hydrothermalis TaxID=563188 RepID=UPI00333FBCD6
MPTHAATNRLGLLIAAMALGLASTAHADWRQYRDGADRNAVVSTDLGVPDDRVTRLDTPEGVRATPTVIGRDLLVGNNNTGTLQRIDPRSGKPRWQTQAPNWVHSEMVWSGDTVVVGYGNRYFTSDADPKVTNYARGTGESGVLALDARTGAQRWQFRTLGEVMPTPAIVGHRVYAATGGRAIQVLSLTDGHQVGLIRLGSFVSMSSPAVDDAGRLFAGGGDPYRLFCIDTHDNRIAWIADFPDMLGGVDDVPPAVAEGVVVTSGVYTTADKHVFDHRLFAYDAASGKLLWQADLGTGGPVKNNRSGAPTIANGEVVVGSPTSKQLAAFDLKTGHKRWSLDTGAIKAPPVIHDGRVYATTTKAQLLVVDAASGRLLHQLRLGDQPLAPAGPVLAGRDLIVPSQDHHVYIVPLAYLEQARPTADDTTAAAP